VIDEAYWAEFDKHLENPSNDYLKRMPARKCKSCHKEENVAYVEYRTGKPGKWKYGQAALCPQCLNTLKKGIPQTSNVKVTLSEEPGFNHGSHPKLNLASHILRISLEDLELNWCENCTHDTNRMIEDIADIMLNARRISEIVRNKTS